MNSIVSLETFSDPELKEAVNDKLSAIRNFEREVPAVFIVHDLPGFSVVYMSQRGLDILGVTLEEVRLGNAEYHQRFFNPEDVPNYLPKIMDLLKKNKTDELTSFFQQVRPSPDHEWTWYLSSTKILLRDKKGEPILTLTLAIPIDSQSHISTKIERLIHENNFLRQNHEVFASLTKREKEILRLVALGMNTTEIAEKLHISRQTAFTHRRNIKSKLKAQTNYDITRFAQAFDLI